MPTVMIDGKKHTPGSNTLKKMKRKAAAEAAAKAGSAPASKPKGKKKKTVVAKEKPPIPAKRSMKDKVKVPKGPMSPGGRKGHVAAHTKGGNGGNKTSSVLGIGPKAKLSTDSSMMMTNYNNKKKRT